MGIPTVKGLSGDSPIPGFCHGEMEWVGVEWGWGGGPEGMEQKGPDLGLTFSSQRMAKGTIASHLT